MAYYGRTTQEPETFNFGGLNLKASALNLKDGEAQEVTNFDVDISGALTTRMGYVVLTSILGPVEYFNNYFTSTGVEVFVVIANHKFYEATSISGPFTDRTGSIILTGTNWIGTYIADSFVIGNGVDQPIVSILGSNIKYLETSSLIQAPSDISNVYVGTAGLTSYNYRVTSVTSRGESTGSSTTTAVLCSATLTNTDYVQISWVPVVGSQAYNVYRYDGLSYVLIGSTIAFTFSDTGLTATAQTLPTSNTAYNTPNDWNLNGAPEGFAVLARGREQHLIAWRKNNVWAAAYGTALDWFTSGDAFSFVVQGGEDNSIKAVVTLYDFTVFFSATNAFVYIGSSASTLLQSKILHTGCEAPYSIVPVGDDIYLWSQFGPTTLSRILQGADVQTTAMGIKVTPLIYEQTNRSIWNKIAGWHDLKNQRVCWAYPAVGALGNTNVLLWSYTIPQADGTKGAWMKYDSWQVINAITSSTTSDIYGVLNGGDIVQLHVGSLDGVAGINSTYKSAWYDLRTWLKKRMLWLDLVMDASYTYNVNVQTAWEFNRVGMTQNHSVSNSMTDGYTVETLGDYNQHRLYTQGDGKHFQFVFTSSNPCKIIAWRPESRIKGLR
jgi:hypothetical protein